MGSLVQRSEDILCDIVPEWTVVTERQQQQHVGFASPVASSCKIRDAYCYCFALIAAHRCHSLTPAAENGYCWVVVRASRMQLTPSMLREFCHFVPAPIVQPTLTAAANGMFSQTYELNSYIHK